LGQQVTQAGQHLEQAEHYTFQRQRAQDVLDGKTQLQDYRQTLQAWYVQRAEGPYQTLSEDTLKEGKRLIDVMGHSLTPQARALFTEDANQVLSVIQQHSLGEYSKRRDQHRIMTMGREIHQVQENLFKTSDPYARDVIVGQFEDLGAQMVDAGLLAAHQWLTMRQKTMDAVALQGNQQMIQAYPDLMRTQYMAQLTGQPTREDLPLAPAESLAELHQQAVTVSKARFAEQEHQERYQAYKLSEQQRVNSRDLTTRLYTTPLTPASVPKFQEILTQAAAGLKAGTLDERAGEHLMNTAQNHMQAAAKPPPLHDDEALASTISLATRMAETPEEFERARELLSTQALGRLKRNTFEDLSDALERRQAASDWRSIPQARAGKDIIMRGAMVPYGGSLAGIMKPQMQQKTSWAVDSWEAQLQEVWNTAPPQRRKAAVAQAAEALAWEARRQHLQPDVNNEADAQEYLPPQVQRANTPQELAQEIHALRMLGWSNGSLLILRDNWHRWYTTWPKGPDGMPQRAGSGSGARTGTSSPSGTSSSSTTRSPYQLPGGTPAESSQGRRSN
jgi:hypothetical protein